MMEQIRALFALARLVFWSWRYRFYSRDLYRGQRAGRGSYDNPLLWSDIKPTLKMQRRLRPTP